MNSKNKNSFPGLIGICSYDINSIGITETAKKTNSDKHVKVFSENKYAKYARQTLNKIFNNRFLKGGTVIRIQQSLFGAFSKSDVLAIQDFFSNANQQVIWYIENQLTSYRISKNENKIKYYQDRLDYLQNHKIEINLFSSLVGVD